MCFRRFCELLGSFQVFVLHKLQKKTIYSCTSVNGIIEPSQNPTSNHRIQSGSPEEMVDGRCIIQSLRLLMHSALIMNVYQQGLFEYQ